MAVAINYLSLFTGHGGLDLGFRLGCEALGIAARCVGYVEREAYAASCLLGRMEESALERAPVFCGDTRDVRGSEFRGIENLWVIGGFPCQDISFAGKGAGIVEGNRSGLWFEYARIVEESGAVGVCAENVAAIIGRGLDLVLQDLARLGFDAEWDRFTASQVGAPHKRERWFCMANHAGQRRQQRRQRERGEPSRRDGQPDGRDKELAYAEGARREGRRGIGGSPDERLLESPSAALFPPGPGDREAWERIVADDSLAFLRPAVEPGVRVLADGLALVVDESRADQLRGGGNGVVPLQAAFAFVARARRLGIA